MMARGFVTLVEQARGSGAPSEVLGTFERRGASLVNPASGKISTLTEDGDDQTTSEQDLRARLAANQAVTFKVWLAGGANDAMCSVEVLQGVRSFYCSLRGLRAPQIEVVSAALFERFLTEVREGSALLFIKDVCGHTGDVPWHEFPEGSIWFQGVMPEVLGVRASDASRVDADLSDSRKEVIDDYVVFRKREQSH